MLDAVEAALPGPTQVFTTAGELVSVAEARERPLEVAAANWVASALAVGAVHPDALMLDVGGTTADLIPVAGGRVAAAGRTDLDRLLARRARLHRGAAHEPRDDRPARPGARAAGARSPPSCSRSAPTSTSCWATSRPRPTRARRPTDARRPWPSPASASPASSAPTPSSSRPPRSTRSPRSSTPSRSARSRRPRGRSPRATRSERAGRAVRGRRVPRPRGGGAPRRQVVEMPWSAAERDAAPAAALAGLAAAALRASC